MCDRAYTRVFTAVLVLLAGLIGAQAATPMAVWIDDAPGGGGTGTAGSPFHWGNSADLFDAGIRSNAPATTFHLRHIPNGRSSFHTRGAYANSLNPGHGFQLKSGQALLGGPGVTLQLVHLVPDARPSVGFNIVLGAISPLYKGGVLATNVLIQDLTVDCNGPMLKAERPYCTVRGIELSGASNTLRNVAVINAIGDRALVGGYDENFVVSLSTYGGSSTHNLIDHCRVEGFHVDKTRSGSSQVMCSAITVRVLSKESACPYYISGAVLNCTVNLNGARAGRYGAQEYGLNCIFAARLAFVGNTINGATRGFSNDTGANTCLLVSSNTFNQPPHSWGAFLLSSSDSLLEHNTFNLGGPGGVAIGVQGSLHGQEAIRWGIRYNQIRSRVAGNSGIYFFPAPRSGPTMPTYIDVEGNLFSGSTSYINVPRNVANGCNYLSGNAGSFRYYTLLREPIGTRCFEPVNCFKF